MKITSPTTSLSIELNREDIIALRDVQSLLEMVLGAMEENNFDTIHCDSDTEYESLTLLECIDFLDEFVNVDYIC